MKLSTRWSVCVLFGLAVTIGLAGTSAQGGRGASAPAPSKGAAPAPAKAASAPPAPMPHVAAAGLRIVGVGLGANGSELHAFNEQPGTAIALAIQSPPNSGIVEFDERGSRIEAFTDDKGQSLLAEGRFGSFPKLAEDGSVALVEVEVHGRPSAGATSLTLQGSAAMTLANGSKPTRLPNIRLEPARTMKLGAATVTIKTVDTSEDSLEVTLALSRTVLSTVRSVRFFDGKGTLLESRRTSSGYMNDAAEVEYRIKGTEKLVAVEFDVWQNIRQIKVPFVVSFGMGIGGDSPTADTAGKPSGPPVLMPGPNDGAASIDAVMKQLQTAAVAGKGRDMLAVIYPDDRLAYGRVMATALAFSTMGSMTDAKANDKAQAGVDAIFAKHKLNMPLSHELADIFKNSDLALFITDALIFMKAQVPKGQDPLAALPVPSGVIDNVKVDGDAASARVGNRDLQFVRINTKWFIRVTR